MSNHCSKLNSVGIDEPISHSKEQKVHYNRKVIIDNKQPQQQHETNDPKNRGDNRKKAGSTFDGDPTRKRKTIHVQSYRHVEQKRKEETIKLKDIQGDTFQTPPKKKQPTITIKKPTPTRTSSPLSTISKEIQDYNTMIKTLIESQCTVDELKYAIYYQQPVDNRDDLHRVNSFEQQKPQFVPKLVSTESDHDEHVIQFSSELESIQYPIDLRLSQHAKVLDEPPFLNENQEPNINDSIETLELDTPGTPAASSTQEPLNYSDGGIWYVDGYLNIFHVIALHRHVTAFLYFTGPSSPIDKQSVKLMLVAQDEKGNTPLHYLFLNERVEDVCTRLANLMLQLDASWSLSNDDGLSPFDLAIRHRYTGTFDLFKEHGANISIIYDTLESYIPDPSSEPFFKEIPSGEMNAYGFYSTMSLAERASLHPRIAVHESAQAFKRKKRMKKWNRMLTKHSSITSKRFKRRVRKGIPHDIRGRAWSYIIRQNASLSFNESLRLPSYKPNTSFYEALLEDIPSCLSLIDMDVRRTMRHHEFLLQRYGTFQCRLFRLLKAYANYDTSVCYCQGMSNIAALLLLQVHDEVETFELFVCLMESPCWHLRHMFREHLPLLHELFYVHDSWLHHDFPVLVHHLTQHGISTGMYATKWYMCLLIDIVPFEGLLRMMDIYFLEGQKVLVSACRGFMRQLSDSLLVSDFEGALQLLQHPDDLDLDIPLFVRTLTKPGHKLREKRLNHYRQLYSASKQSKRHTIV
mmetsp:Transcript_138/g.236  ORF Transcript_138/g.236 Transcript_138/m.236 type:complete len:747 (+) Transcript_138:196-2436(+)